MLTDSETMPRRNKRHRKSHKSEIEEQLAKQRSQRIETEKESATNKEEKPQSIGGFRYDPVLDTYFPEESFPLREEEQHEESPEDHRGALDKRTSPALPVEKPWNKLSGVQVWDALRTCSNVNYRERLYHNAAGRLVCGSMKAAPSTTCRGGRWSSCFPKWTQGDVAAKLKAARWTRSFDVLPIAGKALPSIANVSPLKFDHDAVDILDDGTPRVCHEKTSTVRFLSGYSESLFVGLNASRCHIHDTKGTMVQSLDLPCPLNDVVRVGTALLFATSRQNDQCYPWFVDFELGGICGQPMKFTPPNFPQSDMLCVDRRQQGDCTFFLGHRNGQVTIIDHRDPRVSYTPEDRAFGGVISMAPSYMNWNHLYLRGYFGECRLFDLRRMRTVHSLMAPRINERLTSRCSGIAVDATDNYMLSPFVDSDEVPRIGMWSNHTGDYLGSTRVGPKPSEDVTPTSSTWGMSWIELCSRPTPAWTWGEDGVVTARSGSYGYWYKCGQSLAGPEAPRGFGSLHQIQLDGTMAAHEVALRTGP